MNAVAERTLTPNQAARRARILSAARELVAEFGYDGMIMRDVAIAAKVSPTTVYNLYNTKDELLIAALDDAVAQGWHQGVVDVPNPGLERLLHQTELAAAETTASPAYAKAIAQALFRASEGDQIIDLLLKGGQQAVMLSLRAMQDVGEIQSDVDLSRLALDMVMAFWGTYFQWSSGLIETKHLERALRRQYLSHLALVTEGEAAELISQEHTRLEGIRNE